MSDLTFYTNPQSRGRIVRIMLEELGIPYDTRILEYGTTMKAPDYLAVNPMGKVPAIVHKARVVTETPAIITYLAETFPEAGLAPTEEERADYYRWMYFCAGSFEAAIVDKVLGFEVPEERSGTVGYGTFKLVSHVLQAEAGKRPYICGERFTAADVYVGSQVGYSIDFGVLESTPQLAAYVERLKVRPAWRRADNMDEALMPTDTT